MPEDACKPWYAAMPLGENKLGTVVKDMFECIGVNGMTNHSLRAAGANYTVPGQCTREYDTTTNWTSFSKRTSNIRAQFS